MYRNLRGFINDDRGGGTVMGLLWFMLLVGICGLAVDTTDGFRNRTMLQATADAAALAAVIDLPDTDAAVATAIAYAAANMGDDVNGTVLMPEDVTPGVWKEDTRTFIPASQVTSGDGPLDAVHLMTRRSSQNDNAVPVNFLRIVGLRTWNVRAQAIANAFNPKCLRNGLTAAGIVNITSNNSFVKEICVHGQQGVEMQNNNYFEDGTEVTMRDTDDLTLPSGGMDSNPGLAEALDERNKVPRLVNHIDEIIADFLDPSSGIHSSYINAGEPVITVDDKFDLSTVQPHRVYHVDCKDNKVAAIPSGAVISKVVIIANCNLNIGSGAYIFDAVLASRAGGEMKDKDKAIVQAAAGATLGTPDNCAPGGGVQIFSNATMKFSSSTMFNGVQLVAADDIELGALAEGINGISAEAGGDIIMTANNAFGLCKGNVPMLKRYFYWRLVL